MDEKKKVSKPTLMEWLEHGGAPLLVEAGISPTVLIQLPKSEDFTYIYSQSQRKCGSIYLREPLNYCFLYDRKTHILCGDSYRLTSLCELSKDDFVTEGTLRDQLQERVRAMVEDTVDNDRGNLPVSEVTNLHLKRNLDYYLEYGVKEDAIRHLFADGAFLVSEYQCLYEPDNWTEDTLLEYLRDREGYAQAQADEYIRDHQESILVSLIENEALQTAFDELLRDTEHPAHRMKRITDDLNLCGAKNVRVTILKNGVEFSFKTEASALKGNQNYYSTYSMAAPDRRAFEERFGRGANYHAEDIMKIIYREKEIYRAEAPVPEQQSGMAPTMAMGGL